jgi:hypothetical protein
MRPGSKSAKTVFTLTTDVLGDMERCATEAELITPGCHSPALDEHRGCPDLPSDLKILRYLRGLRIYDDPSKPHMNTGYNAVMRAAHKHLAPAEYAKLVGYMRANGVGQSSRR